MADRSSKAEYIQSTPTQRGILPGSPSSLHHKHHHYDSSRPQEDRTRSSIMQSSDPSREALRRWAADKETHYPGEDGSIDINNPGTMQAMAFGGAVRMPRKGDTLPPPDERLGIGKFGHGQAEYVGPRKGEGGDHIEKTEEIEQQNEGVGKGKGEKQHRLSALFHRKKKGGDQDCKNDDDDIVR